MLILLAESKTMAPNQSEISTEIWNQHKPLFEDMADEIMNYFSEMPPSRIASQLGISNALAVKAHSLAYDFPHKATGYEALFGFTGEAYRGLDASSLPSEAVEKAFQSLRIISSIYGILKASDIIKPYRCEFNKIVSKDNKTPIQIFKPKNTIALVNSIKENKIKDIINLLPADADKCIDWKIVRAYASVHKICFQTISSDGKLKTPIAKRLKELRGMMARQIFTHNLTSFNDLISAESPHYIYSPEHSKPLLPVFLSD